MTATAAQIAPHHNTLTPLGSRRAALFLACALLGEQRVFSAEHKSLGTFDDDLSRQLIIVSTLVLRSPPTDDPPPSRTNQPGARNVDGRILMMKISACIVSLIAARCGAMVEVPLDFNRDIRPILAENCFACHGFDEHARKASLRLDAAEFAYAPREGITAIVPGDLAASELWARINATDEDDVMPPPKSHRTLTAAQKELLRQWIEQGAPYAPHWAFVVPIKRAPPTDIVSPIDAFVRARLADESLEAALTPAAQADATTLIRRAALDLTGLAPSADEVASFIAQCEATSLDAAYELLIDRLLASKHFGEQMALPWLDAARYADTNGFSIDGGRHAWLWRDYVINAFNSNKPFDQFLIEQIAGDLVTAANEETLTATGFQRNAMVTHEGGTIAAENLVNYGADRVRTFSEAVLGLTVACAQCHDHKFDPISQKDYYGLFAFFNTTSEDAMGGDGGNNAAPVAQVHSVLRTGEEDALRARIVALEATLAHPSPQLLTQWEATQRDALVKRGKDLLLHPVKLLKISTPNSGSGFSIENQQFALVERPMGFVAFDVSMELPPLTQPITGLRVVMHPSLDAPAAGWGWNMGQEGKGNFVLTSVSLSAGTVASDQVNLYRMIEPSGVTANTWEPQHPPEGVLNTNASAAWVPDLAHDGPVQLTVTFAQPLRSADATHLTAQLNFGRGGNVTAKRMEFFALTGTDDDSNLPASMIAIVAKNPSQRNAQETREITEYFAQHSALMASTRIDLANARERLAARTQAFATLVMDTAPTPRETFILHRGVYSDPRDKVSAATPAALPAMASDAPMNRLGLAQWVTSPSNPLTARVAVNRLWQSFFGTGIVKSVGDFGTQGEWPSHPELLDWLAVDFVEHGWDVKRLVKSIVSSQTYRQSSASTASALELDPHNRLLARGARFRLSAELIRDGALSTSGLLVTDLGGPSVNPYTPGDPWREISHYGSSPATAQSFEQDHGDKLYRRSLYTYWKRTMPPPNMSAFDAPNREVCVMDRSETNTPLQALVMLNDVQFVEASRAFAQQILHRSGDDEARLHWAFMQATSRLPTVDEDAVLRGALTRERAHFASSPADALSILEAGESPRDESLSSTEHAAWSQVAALLLNLSETITRN